MKTSHQFSEEETNIFLRQAILIATMYCGLGWCGISSFNKSEMGIKKLSQKEKPSQRPKRRKGYFY
jgi:hypothetical protein